MAMALSKAAASRRAVQRGTAGGGAAATVFYQRPPPRARKPRQPRLAFAARLSGRSLYSLLAAAARRAAAYDTGGMLRCATPRGGPAAHSAHAWALHCVPLSGLGLACRATRHCNSLRVSQF